MAKKIFTYRGKTLEELQKLSINEIAEIFPSKQRRKIKRGLSDNEKGLLQKLKTKNGVKTHLRDMIVLPEMIGKTIKIHTGKEFIPIIIQEEMIGYYLGELAQTRKRVAHTGPGVGATRSSSGATKR
ncbi:30S ribosomal protein S19 [Candidatus Woesearchaeota archaeon]|nr:30S ribosomal protein S19 [Candidatus Woesearchaeota archaeon]